MLRGKEILSGFNERYSQSWEKLQSFNAEALIDMQYYLGDQYSAAEKKYLKDNNREAIVNNKILRAVNLLTGEQRLNRLGSAVLATNDNIPEEVLAADQHSIALQSVLQRQYGYNHISDCFHGSAISGINFSEIFLDYSNDFLDGDIKFNRIPYNAMMWDPYFQDFDLSDCGYIFRRKYLSKANIIGLLPDDAKSIRKLKAENRDGKFPDIPYESNPNGQNLLAYTEFWERDTKLSLFMINMMTQEVTAFPDEAKKKEVEKFVNAQNRLYGQEIFKVIQKEKATVNRYIIIEGEVFDATQNPNKINDYPFTPFIAFHTPEYSDYSLNIQSFIRAARDPQKELNKRISKAVDMMDSRLYGGHYVKINKLVDEDDLYNAGNGNIALKDDAIIGQDIAPISLPDVPASLFEMQNVFNENIMNVLNLNDSAFGVHQGGNQSGFMTMLQQSSAMTGLQPLYDNLNRSQTMISQKVVKHVQNWSDAKIEKITGMPVSPMFKDPDLSRYDIACQQVVLTTHQKQLQFSQLVELRGMGVEEITGSMLLKHAPIQGKSEILEEVQAMEQAAAEQAQQMQQMQMQKDALSAELIQSQVEENNADVIRKNARAISDVALSQAHISESDQKRASAVLDMAKAATEISNNEDSRFYSAIDFITSLEDRYRDQDQQELLLNKAIVDDTANKVLNESVTPQQQSVGV